MENNKPNSSKSKWNYIIIGLTAAIMVWLLSQMQNPEQVWQTLKTADMRYMLLSVCCMVFFWYLEGVLMKMVAHGFGKQLKMNQCFRVSMIGQLFNNITPFASGGQPVQAYELARYGVTYGESSCILLVKFAIYQLAMTIYGAATTIWKFKFFSARIPGFGLLVFVGFLVNVTALAVMLAVGFFPKVTRRVLHWLIDFGSRIHIVRKPEPIHERLNAELDMFYNNFQIMRSNPQIVIGPLLVTLAQLTVYFTIPFLIFRSMGIESVSFGESLSATLFVFMVTSFIPAPGASGGAEGSFYWFLSIFITNGDIMLMTTVLWRLFTFYMPIIVGGCFYATRKRHRPNLKAAVAQRLGRKEPENAEE